MTRNRRTELLYKEHKNNNENKTCNFCEVKTEEIVKEFDYFKLIVNLFPYDIWDSTVVKTHYMLIPKKHIIGLSELGEEERIEYINLIADYESSGYSVYSRSSTSHMKSVIHQHTHLIKLGTKRKSFVFYSKSPYLLLTN
jgi:diadenosine tetraphosphate (Ap4A) HIT family hydrolase